MKSIIYRTSSALLGMILCIGVIFADVPTDIIEKARDATILIGAEGEHPAAGGMGTGVIIDPSGLALTNYHVIHRADIIRIYFWDPDNLNNYIAELVGVDPVADLALLKINVKDEMLPLEYLNVEPEKFTIGEPVVAIGHPVGLQWTVTSGTLNHLSRPGRITPYVEILQHSAQINRGNSGGPLINVDGDVVGINTYILMPEGGWSGIAYAIRGDNVEESLRQMRKNGEVKYTAFKIGLRNVHEFFIEAVKEEYPDENIPTGIYGLMAMNVEDDDWAHRQGIRNFDIIVAINGEPTNRMEELADAIESNVPGDIIDLLIIRDGHFRKVSYILGEIEFKEYLDFYDKRVSDRFEKKQPSTPAPIPEPTPESESLPPVPYDDSSR